MTNREKFKDEMEEMLSAFLAVVEEKPVYCEDMDCQECDFRGKCPVIEKCVIDWLNAEYQEPSVDWNKVSIDTPVLVSDTGKAWTRRHFSGIDESDNLLAYAFGKTLWSSGNTTEVWRYMKLAEDNE